MRLRLLKYLLLLVSISLFVVGCENQGNSPSRNAAIVGKGQPAPNFTLSNLQGQKVSLSDFKGKVVLLNLWATWCPPCREEMPSMEMLYRKFQEQGLVILAVNVEEDGQQAVSSFLRRTPYSFPILLDTGADVQNLYKVFQFPETFIIDRNGNVVEKVIGAIDWTGPQAVKLINFLLNG